MLTFTLLADFPAVFLSSNPSESVFLADFWDGLTFLSDSSPILLNAPHLLDSCKVRRFQNYQYFCTWAYLYSPCIADTMVPSAFHFRKSTSNDWSKLSIQFWEGHGISSSSQQCSKLTWDCFPQLLNWTEFTKLIKIQAKTQIDTSGFH